MQDLSVNSLNGFPTGDVTIKRNLQAVYWSYNKDINTLFVIANPVNERLDIIIAHKSLEHPVVPKEETEKSVVVVDNYLHMRIGANGLRSIDKNAKNGIQRWSAVLPLYQAIVHGFDAGGNPMNWHVVFELKDGKLNIEMHYEAFLYNSVKYDYNERLIMLNSAVTKCLWYDIIQGVPAEEIIPLLPDAAFEDTGALKAAVIEAVKLIKEK